MVVVQCKGSIEGLAAAARLREAVTAREKACVVVIDLSQVDSIEAAGMAVLRFLQQWAHKNRIPLKLFNPSHIVRKLLKNASSIFPFEISSLPETMALLARANY
jgi:anti-anti-sigma factor